MKGYVIPRNIKLEELPAMLQYDAPAPVCGPDDILIDVHSAGFNYFGACAQALASAPVCAELEPRALPRTFG